MPDVVGLEFFLNSLAKSSSDDLHEVVHSVLTVVEAYIRVRPDLVKSILDDLEEGVEWSKLDVLQVSKLLGDLSEILVDDLSLLSKIFILLRSVILPLYFEPHVNLIHGSQDASELLDIEVLVHQSSASLP